MTSRCLANARKWRTPLLPTLAVVKHQRWRFAWGLRSFSESFVIFQEEEYIIQNCSWLHQGYARDRGRSDKISKQGTKCFYCQWFQNPATQLSSVISTSSSRGVQQRDTLIYVSCSNFSTTMTLVIWKLLSIWKSAFWMSFQTIQETSAKEQDPN